MMEGASGGVTPLDSEDSKGSNSRKPLEDDQHPKLHKLLQRVTRVTAALLSFPS